ncbi:MULTISPECIES: hypothetical protein [Micromonospora]|uniref:hypothetical protein n=1 Tax=Micromonospora TaxID=1873 RepID=UPI00248C052D|nr:hypothetical protein [Micromonospora sp. WMMC264]WBB88207.1 hypothetical protein O7542_13970 [Micromonospora sp. WMMC264]
MADDRPRYEIPGLPPLPPPRKNIADPTMLHHAYRRQPGYRPPPARRPLLDDNARISAWTASGVLALVVLTVLVFAAPILLCPLLVVALLGWGTWLYVKGWRPRQRLL